MNLKLKDIVNKAQFLADDEILYLERIHNIEYSVEEKANIFNEKFADLLIAECTNIVMTTEIETNNNAKLRGEIVSKFKKHFYY